MLPPAVAESRLARSVVPEVLAVLVAAVPGARLAAADLKQAVELHQAASAPESLSAFELVQHQAR